MATIQPVKIELSTETKRAFLRLTKALEDLKIPGPDLSGFAKGGMIEPPDPNIFDKYFGKKEFPRVEGDTVVIGPECFAYIDENVISWKGQEYLKPCGEFVGVKDNGARNYCVKVVNHPSKVHEDYAGNTRENI